VAKVTNDASDDYAPAYAPNGTIVFTSDRATGATRNYDLWRYTPGAAIPFLRLTQTPDQDEIDPTVSPSGAKLAFAVVGRTWNGSEMRVTDLNAGNGSSMWWTLGPNHPMSSPTFSRDGKQLMFVRTSFGEAHLMRVTIATATGDQITPDGVAYSTPGWFN
jgi:Tol biopolymer transport system component